MIGDPHKVEQESCCRSPQSLRGKNRHAAATVFGTSHNVFLLLGEVHIIFVLEIEGTYWTSPKKRKTNIVGRFHAYALAPGRTLILSVP